MKSKKNENDNKNKGIEVKSFPVPLSMVELNDKIVIYTNIFNEKERDFLINNALKFHSQGNLLKAEIYYQQFIKKGFVDEKIFSNYGSILKKQGKLKEAEIYLIKSIKLNPKIVNPYLILISILISQARIKEAEPLLRKVIYLKPDLSKAYLNLGNILRELGELDEAEIFMRKVIDLQPDYKKAYLNLGNILYDKGKLKEAELFIRKAINLSPENSLFHSNLGKVLQDLGRYKEAEVSSRKAIELKPDFAEAYSNLGNILRELCNFKEAEMILRKAIELEPENANAHNNLAHVLLKSMNFVEGWEHYEWRWKTKENMKTMGKKLKTNRSEWEPSKRGRILLWEEQGLGDVILFSSLIPDFLKEVDKLIVKIDKRLIKLYKRSLDKSIKFISRTDFLDENDYDFHISIASLPKYLRPSLKSFEICNRLRLRVDEDKSNNLRSELINNKYEKVIGVCWKSNKTKVKKGIDFTLETFILGIYSPKIRFVCLQYGEVEEEINELRKKCGIEIHRIKEIDLFNDIDGLAALINACDEVVSIGNTTSFLAGAIGKTSYILLSSICHWTNGIDNNRSYWFPSIKFFRQDRLGRWEDSLEKIKKEIKV